MFGSFWGGVIILIAGKHRIALLAEYLVDLPLIHLVEGVDLQLIQLVGGVNLKLIVGA